jgi:hypothetical protein
MREIIVKVDGERVGPIELDLAPGEGRKFLTSRTGIFSCFFDRTIRSLYMCRLKPKHE